MASVAVQDDVQSVSQIAADITIQVLQAAIADHRAAFWLLSGGTAPMGAYKIIAEHYKDSLDWNQVFVAIGDERCVPFDDPDASWTKIAEAFIDAVNIPTDNRLRPQSDQDAEAAAKDYSNLIGGISANEHGVPHFDMVWLGMGEDGHTLSLFPGNPALNDDQSLVVAVHDSPKKPLERISLTLKALGNASNGLVLVTGIEKGQMIQKIFKDEQKFPITSAVSAIEAGGGKVTWLLDEAASSFLNQR